MKFNKSINVYLILLTSLTITISSTFAMEADDLTDNNIVIINQNSGQKIENYVTGENALINIFGATLRYSFFDRYQQTLLDHFDKLTKIESKKNISKSIIKAKREITQNISKQSFGDYFQNLNSKIKSQMFFHLGLQKENIQNNFRNLIIETLSIKEEFQDRLEENNTSYLIHVLMPCYFNDISKYLTESSLTYESLETFLKECANFYKKMYQTILGHQNLEKALKIIIFIPDLEYIKKLIKNKVHTKTYEKLEQDVKVSNIIEVLYQEIIVKLNKNNLYVLINPDLEQIKLVGNHLLGKGFNVDSRELCIISESYKGSKTSKSKSEKEVKKITNFFPYTLRRENEYSNFRQTPLVNQNLADFIKMIEQFKQINLTKEETNEQTFNK